MKKLFALFTTLALVFAACMTVFAAPGKFISSPSGNAAPVLVEYSNADPNCTAELKAISYAERYTLSDVGRRGFEDAYNQILDADDISAFNSDLAKLANDKNIPSANLAISDLFDIEYSDCVEHDNHGAFKIKLSADTLNNFVALMCFDGAQWHLIKDAEVDGTGTYLTFTADNLGVFAVVVDTTEVNGNGNSSGSSDGSTNSSANNNASGTSPQTGDNFSALWIVLMVVSALGLGVVAFIFVKQQRKTN